MLSPRQIMIAMIALLTAANMNPVFAQRLRFRTSPPRTTIICPDCPPYPLAPPCEECPPVVPPSEEEPAAKPDSEKSDEPTQPQQPTQPQAPPTAPPTFTPPSQPTTAATSPLSSAPNMIGDFFGNSTTFAVRTPGIGMVAPNAITNTPMAPHFAAATLTSDGRLQINTMFTNFGVGPYPVTLESLRTETDINTIGFDAGGTVMTPIPWSDSPGFDRFALRPVVGQTYPIDGNMDGIAEGYTIINGGTAILYNVPLTAIAPVADGVVTKDGGVVGVYDAGVDDPFTITADAINVPILTAQVPVGALAGRIKLAENSSPMPRDRVFIDYSYFDQIALAPGGVNVNRVTPGFEKTFLGGDASFEIRTPFATTLDSDIDNIDLNGPFSSDKVEFGNVWTNLKFLLYRNQEFAWSTGLGMTFPTADDTSVALSNGVESFRVNNNAVHLMPFLGGLWTPNTRFFAQGILQFDVTTNGNEVLANLNPNDLTYFDPVDGVFVDLAGPAGLQQIGELDDPTFLYADISLGYWLYQNDCPGSFVTGIAGLFELHYNTTLNSFDSVRADIPGTGVTHPTDPNLTYAPVQFQINGPKEFDQLNMIIGSTIEFQKNTVVQLGYGLPIAEDKVFDGEFRLNVNHYFGRSARRTPLARAGSL